MEDTEMIPKKQYEDELRKLRKLYKPNNALSIPVTTILDFFKWWCIFLRPFISLTDREIDVVASLLKQRYELSKGITDPTILDRIVMDSDVLNRVAEECKITRQHLYVVMSSLKKKNVVDKSINPKIVPNIRTDDNGVFKLAVLFKMED